MLLLLVACTAPEVEGTRPYGTSDEDTPAETLTLDVEATAVPTVFHTEFAGPPDAVATLEYGIGDAFDHEIAADETEDGLYAASLLGIAADETWTVRVRLESGAGVEYSPAVDLPTVETPEWLPTLSVSGAEHAPTGGFRLVSNTRPGMGMVGIVDGAGRYVWWAQGSSDPGDMTVSARMSPDGTAVDWLEVGISGTGEVLHRTRLDGSRQTDVRVPGAHHDFLAIGDDHWAVLVKDTREVEGVNVVGDALVEFGADGSSRVVWSAWDTFDLDVEELSHGDEGGLWWTHANSLAFDGSRYWISLYEFNAVAVVERDSGALVAQLGGHGSTATIEGQPFNHQHSPVLDGNRLLIFDNSIPDRDPWISAAREYEISADLSTMREVWNFENPDAAYASNFGNAIRRADGSAAVSWGNLATVDEIDADGNLVWRMQATDGTTFGYVQTIENLGGATW